MSLGSTAMITARFEYQKATGRYPTSARVGMAVFDDILGQIHAPTRMALGPPYFLGMRVEPDPAMAPDAVYVTDYSAPGRRWTKPRKPPVRAWVRRAGQWVHP